MYKVFIFSYFFAFLLCMSNFRSVYATYRLGAQIIYKGKYTSNISNYEVVVPQRVNKDGTFLSNVVPHQHSKRSTRDMDKIFYKIPISGKEYLIELSPSRKLISPGAVIETYKVDAAKLNRRNATIKRIEQMFENLNMKKLKNAECHFSGYVKGENISKAALSNCYGLAGFIQIDKGFYTIEPVAEHNPFIEDAFPHIIYKSNGLDNSSVCHTMGKLATTIADKVERMRRENSIRLSTPLYIETLIVMDKSLINYHQESDCENYVLTVFNMASNLFHDASLGLVMTLTIVRIIRLEVENMELNLMLNADAQKTLEHFQTWQYEINPGDDTHPNHHDIAILITRVDVCYAPSSCGLLGLSTIGKACDPKLSAILCEDNGLRLGFVIAHEIGHLLGAEHDSNNSTCNGTDLDGIKTVMHPEVPLNSQTWSKCSQAHIKTFLKSGLGSCLLDEPEDHRFNVQDLLPGVMYNADFQCKHLIKMDARECDLGSTCDSLNCYVPGYACILTHTPPADGTRCEESMWCHDGKCLVVGQRPGAVDGNWGEWSPWSDCTRTCGSGVSTSIRQCDRPLPSHGGKNCIGERKRYKVCATTPCKTGRPSFRDVQCGEFNDWIYPEDGKTHTWREYYLHEDNPCILYCVNEEKKVAALKPRVVDGTMCYRGIRDICVAGTCKTLPCDLHFESNAVEDACGMCHGDGTSCEFSGGTESYTKLSKGLTKLVSIPSGTKNIKVEEMSPTLSRIVVKDKETKDVYIKGRTLGMYNVPGSQAWLGMIRKNQEALSIPGPITKPLSIWIQRVENVTVKWSMALPPSQQRKPEFTWDFLKWSSCSAKCGPGTQKSEPSCMEEKAGLVENSFCADLEMPPVKVRPCEIVKCEPRWMVGDWKGCQPPFIRNEVNSTTKIRKRVVYCVKAVGEGEGETEIVSSSECPAPRPHDTETCESRQKREDTESISLFSDDSMFRSDTAEFGFHKKYDDYLTHFAALSVPQRKSETIPVHLVSSPHFKHYFRVLETPEDCTTEFNSDGDDKDFQKNGDSGHQIQNKVSPDFYKNTFSGSQVDVSHMRMSRINVKKRDSFLRKAVGCEGAYKVRRNRQSTDRNMRSKKVSSTIISPFGSNYRFWRKKKTIPSLIRNKSKHQKKNYISKKNFFKSPPSEYSLYDSCKMVGPLRQKRKNRFTEKKSKHSSVGSIFQNMHKFFFNKENKKFNYSSPNITDVIQQLRDDDAVLRNPYIKSLLNVKNDNPLEIRKGGKSSLNAESLFDESLISQNIMSKFPFSKDLHRFKMSLNQFKYNENDENCKLIKWQKMMKEGFDGSGNRRLNYTTKEIQNKPQKNNEKVQHFKSHKKNYFSNPFDPIMPGQINMDSAKHNLKKKKLNTCTHLFFEKTNKKHKYKNLKKRNVRFIVMQGGYNNLAMYDSGVQPLEKNFHRKISKRLSHKWKKQKSKDTSSKSNKESCGSGCGTETRNYLNNLFRDSHSKGSNKQEPKQENENMVINTGRLIIDRDLVDHQKIDIVLQDDDYDLKPQYIQLPRPSLKKKKMTLRGQEVFDLYKKIQQRNNRKAKNDLETKKAEKEEEKIEIDVKIPDKPETPSPPMAQPQPSQPSATTQSVTEKKTEKPDIVLNVSKMPDNSTKVELSTQTITKKGETFPATSTPEENTSKSQPQTEMQSSTMMKTPEQTTTITVTTTTATMTKVLATTQSPASSSAASTSTKPTTEAEEDPCNDYDIPETETSKPTTSTTETTSKKKKKGKKGKGKPKKFSDSDGTDTETQGFSSSTVWSKFLEKA